MNTKNHELYTSDRSAIFLVRENRMLCRHLLGKFEQNESEIFVDVSAEERQKVVTSFKNELQTVRTEVEGLQKSNKEHPIDITEEERKQLLESLRNALQNLDSASFAERQQAAKEVSDILQRYKNTPVKKEILDLCWNTFEDITRLPEVKVRLYSLLQNLNSDISLFCEILLQKKIIRRSEVLPMVKKLTYTSSPDELVLTCCSFERLSDKTKGEIAKKITISKKLTKKILLDSTGTFSDTLKMTMVSGKYPFDIIEAVLFAPEKQCSTAVKHQMIVLGKSFDAVGGTPLSVEFLEKTLNHKNVDESLHPYIKEKLDVTGIK